MGYQEYYQLADILPLGAQEYAYRNAFGWLKRRYPDFLPETTPLTFVLGGFHPATSTPENFLELTRSVHEHPDDEHIFMDMNLEPLLELDKPERFKRLRSDYIPVNPSDYYHKKQASLEDMRFHDSVDVFILDRTLDFMDDDQVREFARSASEGLTRNGIVLATIKDPILPKAISELRGEYKIESHNISETQKS